MRKKESLIDVVVRARFFIAAILVHALLFMVLFGITVFEPIPKRQEMMAETLILGDGGSSAPPPAAGIPSVESSSDGGSQPIETQTQLRDVLTSTLSDASFSVTPFAPINPAALASASGAPGLGQGPGGSGTPGAGPSGQSGRGTQFGSGLGKFVTGWRKGGSGGAKGILAEFTIAVGVLSGGGDSLAFMRQAGTNSIIVGGSIPNLAEMINILSKKRMKARIEGKPTRLDSRDIFESKPPFIYLTGRRDFQFTEAEIKNLREYVAVGGCIWADSALPGRGSPFDIAFRREIKRVIPDEDKLLEPLESTDQIYTGSIFPLSGAPSGLNYFQEPVEAIKIEGIVSVLYTLNGYGAMWQLTLDPKLRDIDQSIMVASDRVFFDNRDVFFRNVESEPLLQTYRLGVNIVAYLLTRFEGKVRGAEPRS